MARGVQAPERVVHSGAAWRAWRIVIPLILLVVSGCAALEPDEFYAGFERSRGDLANPLQNDPWAFSDQDLEFDTFVVGFTWEMGQKEKVRIKEERFYDREQRKHDAAVAAAQEGKKPEVEINLGGSGVEQTQSGEEVVSGIPMFVWFAISSLLTAAATFLARNQIKRGVDTVGHFIKKNGHRDQPPASPERPGA